MSCARKERTGFCSHPQCQYPDETGHGYECVDIEKGFCEVGENCLEKCDYSWQVGTEREREAIASFKKLKDEVDLLDQELNQPAI